MAFVQTGADLRRLIAGAGDDPHRSRGSAGGHGAIADSGVGMDWETQSRMFEPFFTTKRQDEGAGLGLSVTHGIVRNCGGSIAVDSVMGGGTTMNVYFPAITT